MLVSRLVKISLFVVPLCYFYCGRRVPVIVLIISALYFSVFKFFGSSSVKKGKIPYSSFISKIGERGVSKIFYLLVTLFIIVNSFEKDVAIFSSTVALSYLLINSFFKRLRKLKSTIHLWKALLSQVGYVI